jgi:hypothetical protein
MSVDKSERDVFLRRAWYLEKSGASRETVSLLEKAVVQVNDMELVGVIAELCVLYTTFCRYGLSDEKGKSFLIPDDNLIKMSDTVLLTCGQEVVGVYQACANILGDKRALLFLEVIEKLHKEVTYLSLMNCFTDFLCKLNVYIDPENKVVGG